MLHVQTFASHQNQPPRRTNHAWVETGIACIALLRAVGGALCSGLRNAVAACADVRIAALEGGRVSQRASAVVPHLALANADIHAGLRTGGVGITAAAAIMQPAAINVHAAIEGGRVDQRGGTCKVSPGDGVGPRRSPRGARANAGIPAAAI